MHQMLCTDASNVGITVVLMQEFNGGQLRWPSQLVTSYTTRFTYINWNCTLMHQMLYTDASNVGITVVLMQEFNGGQLRWPSQLVCLYTTRLTYITWNCPA